MKGNESTEKAFYNSTSLAQAHFKEEWISRVQVESRLTVIIVSIQHLKI
ncbi:MAG TPA: hypothetical protein VD794_17070 [Flavisolibacter sp.]|nr:hypothetical protein [Flavisolibacter sp.]